MTVYVTTLFALVMVRFVLNEAVPAVFWACAGRRPRRLAYRNRAPARSSGCGRCRHCGSLTHDPLWAVPYGSPVMDFRHFIEPFDVFFRLAVFVFRGRRNRDSDDRPV